MFAIAFDLVIAETLEHRQPVCGDHGAEQGNRVNGKLNICAGLPGFSLSTPGGEGRGEAGAARTGPAPLTPGTLRAGEPTSPCPLLPEEGRRGKEISILWPVRASPDCPVALKALPWLPASVRDTRAFRVEQWSDFTTLVKL
jgi:hypothetical protein